jgi:hypothetical protein
MNLDGLNTKLIKKVDGLTIPDPQATFEYAERVSGMSSGVVEALGCVNDKLNRLEGSEGLMMIASGTASNKTADQILASQIGNDDVSDFITTRGGSQATRVNSQGLVEKGQLFARIDYSKGVQFNTLERSAVNLALWSEDFDDAVWSKTNATVTANQTPAPDGTLTADEIADDSTSGVHRVFQSITVSIANHTVSIYAKINSLNCLWIRETSDSAVNYFDLSDQTTQGTNNPTIKSVGNGWYRCSITYSQLDTAATIQIGVCQAKGTQSYIGNGSSLYFWGAQLEQADNVGQYAHTFSVIAGVPPIYDRVGCPSVLTEPASTNLALHSEEFDDATWVKLEATISANSEVSPDGTLDADKLIESITSSVHQVSQLVTINTGGITASIFAKAGGRTNLQIDCADGATGSTRVDFDIENGIVTLINEAGSWSNTTGKIEDYGNGWFLCSLLATKNNGTTLDVKFRPILSDGTSLYVGDAVSGVHLWGAQIEQLSYPTSYIPTISSASTRNLDNVNLAGNYNNFNDAEGILVVEMSALANDGSLRRISVSDGTTSNRVHIYFSSVSNTINFILGSGGAIQVNVNVSVDDVTVSHRCAFSWKANDSKMYIDGVMVAEDLTVITPIGLNQCSFNSTTNPISNVFLGNTKEVTVLKSADANLMQLTGYQTYEEMAISKGYSI